MSAIVLTYNQARFVRQCLDGLAAQTRSDWELVIADDASLDGALDVARGWCAEHGVTPKIVDHRENLGLCRTLNDAVALCHGEYVAMIAADDRWEPRKFEVQVAALEDRADAAVAYSGNRSMDQDGRMRPDVWHVPATPQPDLFTELLGGTIVGPLSTLIRRSALVAVGGFDEHLVFEDWDMWLRLSERHAFVHSEYLSATYRYHGASMSASPEWRVAILRSSRLLLEKWTGRRREWDRAIARSLMRIGWRQYRLGDPAALSTLSRVVELQPSRRAAARLALARLRVPPAAVDWLASVTSARAKT